MPKESDWKLFRKRLPEWQERHMQVLLDEYAKIIDSSELASTRFWKLDKRLRKDVRHVGVCAVMRRSTMFINLTRLLDENAITLEDLDGFSEDLKQRVSITYRGCTNDA